MSRWTTELAGKSCCTWQGPWGGPWGGDGGLRPTMEAWRASLPRGRLSLGVAGGAGIGSRTGGGGGDGVAQGRACVWPGHEAPTQLPTPTLLSLIWASLAEGACPYCVPGSERGAGKHEAGARLSSPLRVAGTGLLPARSRRYRRPVEWLRECWGAPPEAYFEEHAHRGRSAGNYGSKQANGDPDRTSQGL